MLRHFDTVISSSDLSLDRVLNAGLPVALVFCDHDLPDELQAAMEDMARRHSGQALIVRLERSSASQAVSRFGVSQLPAVVTLRDGKVLTSQDRPSASDLRSHVAYLLGQGPAPALRMAERRTADRQDPTAAPITVNEADFERVVLRADRPVLVDFWAPWCGPCRMVAPTVEALAREHAAGLRVVKVNVDENPYLASRYGAMSIPTMIVVKNGREVDRWVGAMPANALRSRVARWIQGERQTA